MFHVHCTKCVWCMTTYIAQPPLIDFKHAYRVIGLRHRCDPIKIRSVKFEIEHISVNPTQEGETTYHGHARAAQPLINPSKGCLKTYRPRCRCGRIKPEPVKVSQTPEDRKTYWICASIAQPPRYHLKCHWEVHRTRCHRG